MPNNSEILENSAEAYAEALAILQAEYDECVAAQVAQAAQYNVDPARALAEAQRICDLRFAGRFEELAERYAEYLGQLEEREEGEYSNGPVDWESETVEEEREKQEEELRQQAEDERLLNLKWTQFDKVKTFYEKKTKDGLYDFTATWDGQGQHQENGTIIYGALFKINKVLISNPLGSRKLMEVQLIETPDWAAYNPDKDKNDFIALTDDFALEYEASMAAPPSDDNPFFGGGSGYTFDLVFSTFRTIPNTIISIFQGFFLVLPLLTLLWGAFFGIKFTLKIGQIWVDKIGSS